MSKAWAAAAADPDDPSSQVSVRDFVEVKRYVDQIPCPSFLPFVLLVFLLPHILRKPLLCGRPAGHRAGKQAANGPEFCETTVILQIIPTRRVCEE